MRAESVTYREERKKYVTAPNLFVRFFHTPSAESAQEWAFSRDFSGRAVLEPTIAKLQCVRRVIGNTQTVDPIAGTSTNGTLSIELVNINRVITKYVSDPALPLAVPLSDTLGVRFDLGGFVSLTGAIADSAVVLSGDGNGYPPAGHLSLGTEDIAYTGYTVGGGVTTFTGITRASRGTIAQVHPAGTLARNGEQIRRGQRLTLFTGYAPLEEIEYGPGPGYVRMQIQSIASPDDGMTWLIGATDIQRFIQRSVFTSATSDSPTVLGPDHPLTIALKVLHSTGSGTNGPYDVLPREQGAAVPQAFVATDLLEFLRDAVVPNVTMAFREIQATDAKSFIEGQCFRPLNLVPFITQRGRYSARPFRQPIFVRSGTVAFDAYRAA
jgi:hypothetical protein